MFEARFQTFDEASERQAVAGRVAALRAAMQARGLDAFIVPHADRHQSEYTPPSEERLAWLTGFTGSAGAAVVLREEAALFVDGRYTLQAAQQTDPSVFAIRHLVDEPPQAWLAARLKPGMVVGYDPWLHTAVAIERLAAVCAKAEAVLRPLEDNPIDPLWNGRPAAPHAPVRVHDLAHAGRDAGEKLAGLRTALAALPAAALVVSDPQSLAWLFNIRGGDVAHTPVALAFALVGAKEATIFIDAARLGAAAAHLQAYARIAPPEDFLPALAQAAAGGTVIALDKASAADRIARTVREAGGTVLSVDDPIALPRALKNAAEIAGTRAAHLRDGLALSRFLAWLDREAQNGTLTEIDVVAALESFRREDNALRDISFPTIAGTGPHGAIVHYRVTHATNRKIAPGDLLLVDSGAQYPDGTTDVTRTIAIGPPSVEQRDRFTRVLRGHIALARAVFPKGTTGAQLDALARQYLWQAGLDFDHGTGHGVGSYLSVHEGPARISRLGSVALQAGMILSNEPGYYKADAYGIRIENLVLVKDAPLAEAERPMLCFETLTLAPIDGRLIDTAQLARDDLVWLDTYHAQVREALMPLADSATQTWLEAATRPLPHSVHS